MMLIDTKYDIGDIVYLTTDTEQRKRLVTGLFFTLKGMTYELSCGTATSNHYEFEISEKENILIKND